MELRDRIQVSGDHKREVRRHEDGGLFFILIYNSLLVETELPENETGGFIFETFHPENESASGEFETMILRF